MKLLANTSIPKMTRTIYEKHFFEVNFERNTSSYTATSHQGQQLDD